MEQCNIVVDVVCLLVLCDGTLRIFRWNPVECSFFATKRNRRQNVDSWYFGDAKYIFLIHCAWYFFTGTYPLIFVVGNY